MVYAELGAMLPATGGQYVFMRYMYGDFWAYLFGWAEFIVINTAGTAGVALSFQSMPLTLFRFPVLFRK
jgi:APA family basic amino acid/polyamine antiporter